MQSWRCENFLQRLLASRMKMTTAAEAGSILCWSLLLFASNVTSYKIYKPQSGAVPGPTPNLKIYDLAVKDPETQSTEQLKCSCTVVVNNSSATYSMGEVSMDRARHLREHSSQPKSTCRIMRHHCRNACGERLQEDFSLEEVSQKQIGYALCQSHRLVTAPGGLAVSARAQLDGCTQHLPITLYEISNRLCCGFTFITNDQAMGADKSLMVFGWNPDCFTQTYVL